MLHQDLSFEGAKTHVMFLCFARIMLHEMKPFLKRMIIRSPLLVLIIQKKILMTTTA